MRGRYPRRGWYPRGYVCLKWVTEVPTPPTGMLSCPEMFSLQPLNSVTNIVYKQDIRTYNFLHKTPRCLHGASKTQAGEGIFKFTSMHALVIHQIH